MKPENHISPAPKQGKRSASLKRAVRNNHKRLCSVGFTISGGETNRNGTGLLHCLVISEEEARFAVHTQEKEEDGTRENGLDGDNLLGSAGTGEGSQTRRSQ